MKETIFQLFEFGREKPCVIELKGLNYLLFLWHQSSNCSLDFPISDYNFLLENYGIKDNVEYFAQYPFTALNYVTQKVPIQLSLIMVS